MSNMTIGQTHSNCQIKCPKIRELSSNNNLFINLTQWGLVFMHKHGRYRLLGTYKPQSPASLSAGSCGVLL